MKVSDSPMENTDGLHEKYVGSQLRTCVDCPNQRDEDFLVVDTRALDEAREWAAREPYS